MKTRLMTLIVGLVVSLSLGLWRASAELEVSVGLSIHATTEFYEPLAPSGTWVEVGSYGRCWHPAGVAVGWRPYCNGNWQWTDSGWYWVSDEPWGWACYHYGTWGYDSRQGWFWVPGVEWAPAWVDWRMGGDYVGWVPCAPRGFVVVPAYYVFVEGRNFRERVRPDVVIINNQTVFNRTTETATARHENRQFDGKTRSVVVNEGPGADRIEKASGKQFAAVSVREADRQTYVSVPQKMKQPAAEPGTKPVSVQEPSNPLPGHQPAPGENPKRPDKVLLNPETPREKVVPPQNVIPQPPPDKVVPRPPSDKVIPQPPPDRVTPQSPSDKVNHPPNQATPPNREQRPPQEITPPAQSPTPHENPNPDAKGPDQEKDNNKGQGDGHDRP
jgi:hypothetical protein